MKKIRIIALILAGLMTVGSLGACVSDTPENPTQDGEQTTPSGANNNGNGEANNSNGNPSNNGNDSADNNGNGNNEATQNYTIDSIEDFNEGIVVYQGTITAEDGSQTVGYGYIDSTGKVITPPIYEKVCVFYKGLAAVVKGENQKGYIDTTGKEVIPCVYSSITSIMDTLAWVTTADGVEQMINAKGEVVYTATGKEIAKGYYQNGFFWIETKEEKISGDVHTMTYYNEKGEVAFSVENAMHVEDTRYIEAAELGNSNFDENGYAIVKLPVNEYRFRLWFIDDKGHFVDFGTDTPISWVTDSPMSIHSKKGNWYYLDIYVDAGGDTEIHYIDLQNKIVKEEDFFNNFGDLNAIGNDYYWLSGGAYFEEEEGGVGSANCFILKGYGKAVNEAFQADKFLFLAGIEEFAGASVLGVMYHEINGKDAFVVQLQSVSGVGYMAVVDFEGNVVVSPFKAFVATKVKDGYYSKYIMNPVSAGLIISQDQDTKLYGYIDLNGNTVIPAQYESATDFQGEGDDAVAVVNGNTIINRKGEVIFSVAAEQN